MATRYMTNEEFDEFIAKAIIYLTHYKDQCPYEFLNNMIDRCQSDGNNPYTEIRRTRIKKYIEEYSEPGKKEDTIRSFKRSKGK